MTARVQAAKEVLRSLAKPTAWTSNPQSLPANGGSYLLLMELRQPGLVPAHFGARTISPGIYLYAGSANGPGGIRARCARHFRQEKKLHWHADWLTLAAASLQAVPFHDKSECELVDDVLKGGRADHPIKGFGSSDCTSCEAHLVRLSIDH